MAFVDYVIVVVILAVLTCGIWVVRRSKKKGKCVGCPDSCACSSGNCSCGCSSCNSCGEKH